MKNKSGFWAWCMIDFANSLLYTNLILYLPLWLTIESNISDFYFNLFFIGSTVLALILAPLLGVNGDKNNRRLLYLKSLNYIVLILGLAIAIIGLLTSAQFWAYVCGILFMLLNTSYLLSLQFYDSMLPDLQSSDKLAKGSAIGFSMGWVGAIIGVLVVMPIASLGITESRLYALLFAAVIGAIVLIPSLSKLKPRYIANKDIIIKPKSSSFKVFLRLISKKSIFLFLIAYFIFMDSILTIQSNLSIYVERVFGLGDTLKGFLAIIIIVVGVVGALSTMNIKKSRSVYRWILVLVIISSFFIIFSSLANQQNVTIVLLIISFLLFGAIISLSRTYFSKISDVQYRSTSFSWYSIAQKSSSLIGPLIWGGLIAGSYSYPSALLVMGFLMLISVFPLIMAKKRLGS